MPAPTLLDGDVGDRIPAPYARIRRASGGVTSVT
jgi:hypothetical protein